MFSSSLVLCFNFSLVAINSGNFYSWYLQTLLLRILKFLPVIPHAQDYNISIIMDEMHGHNFETRRLIHSRLEPSRVVAVVTNGSNTNWENRISYRTNS